MVEPGYEVTGVSTGIADRKDRPDLWAGHVHDMQGAFSLGFGDTENFAGSTKAQRWRDRAVVQFSSTAISYRRTARHAAGDEGAGARLIVPLRGNFGLSQRREVVDLVPGSIGMFRMDAPMALEHASGTRALIVSVPDGVITRRLAHSAPLLMEQQRPLVAMLIGHTKQLAAHRERMTATEFVKGTGVLYHLLECVLDENRANHLDGYAGTAERARLYLVKHSDDPALTPTSLAAALGVSLGYLHRALKTADTTPGKLLRTIRLERAWERLREPDGRTIDEIAYRSGFRATPTFHQNFVKYFGKTPGRARAEFLSADAVRNRP